MKSWALEDLASRRCLARKIVADKADAILRELRRGAIALDDERSRLSTADPEHSQGSPTRHAEEAMDSEPRCVHGCSAAPTLSDHEKELAAVRRENEQRQKDLALWVAAGMQAASNGISNLDLFVRRKLSAEKDFMSLWILGHPKAELVTQREALRTFKAAWAAMDLESRRHAAKKLVAAARAVLLRAQQVRNRDRISLLLMMIAPDLPMWKRRNRAGMAADMLRKDLTPCCLV